MTLTPSTLRLDLKCGRGAIRQGQKCSKGAATQVTRGLKSATTQQLRLHNQMLQNDLIKNYGGMQKASANFAAFKQWAVKQREYKEMRAVQSILSTRNDSTASRLDLKCGKGSISKGEKCHKGPALSAGQIAGAAALTLGAGALTAYALTRGKKVRSAGPRPGAAPSPTPSGPLAPHPSAPKGLARLTGAPEPFGLLPPGRRPKSKTQRMRENTTAAMRQAEGAIGQTAREEVRRIGQIGNTMASVGEATGMATKTAFREVRLRTEAARRRFEPGYRRSPAAALQRPAQLAPGNDPALELPFNPKSTRPPEAVPIDPRTGQPRRRRATGFGPRRDGGMVSFGHPVYVDPAR